MKFLWWRLRYFCRICVYQHNDGKTQHIHAGNPIIKENRGIDFHGIAQKRRLNNGNCRKTEGMDGNEAVVLSTLKKRETSERCEGWDGGGSDIQLSPRRPCSLSRTLSQA